MADPTPDPTTTPTPTPTEPQDARFVDFVFSVSGRPPDDAWDEVADLIAHWAERHGLDVLGIASHAVYSTGANVPAAAAPDERETLAKEHARVRRARVFDHHRYDDKPPQPNDYVAADVTLAALAARPAPVVSGEEWLSGPAVDMLPVGSVVLDYEAEAWQRVAFGMWVCTSGNTARSLAWTDEPAEHQEFRVLYRPTVADAPAAEPVDDRQPYQGPTIDLVLAGHDMSAAPHYPGPGKWCDACPVPAPAADDEGGQER